MLNIEVREMGTPEWPERMAPVIRHVVEFPDWYSFLNEVADDTPPTEWLGLRYNPATREWVNDGEDMRTSHRRVNLKEDPWYGTNTYEDAVLLARFGWLEGAQMIERFTEATYDKLSSLIILPTIRYSEVPGMDVDIERYIEGEPQCWRDQQDWAVEGPGRAIRLVYNMSAAAGISTRVVMAKGAAIAALIQLLELSQQRTEVVVADVTTGGPIAMETYVTVKKADEPVDPVTLSFALAHPSMLRRFLLCIEEKFPAEVRSRVNVMPGRDYGMPGECSSRGDIYIGASNFGDVRWKDEEAAARWVVRLLAEQGVHLKDDAGEFLEVAK